MHLSGNVSVTGSNTFTVGTGLTTLGGNLSLTGTADVQVLSELIQINSQ